MQGQRANPRLRPRTLRHLQQLVLLYYRGLWLKVEGCVVSLPTAQEIHFEKERAGTLASYKAALDARDKDLSEARKSMGPGSERWKVLEAEHDSAQGTCKDIFAALQRLTDGKRIPEWLILILAIAFAAMEAPINKFMLDNILRGNNFDSYVLSLFLTFIMLLLAHTAGMQARHIRGAYEDKIYFSKIVVSIVLLGILAICVGALTIGRAYYSTAAAALPTSNIFSEIQHQVKNVGPWSAFIGALSDQAAFFLATLNIAGIAGAFILAFISHDSDMVYQSALDKEQKSGRKRERMTYKYDKRNQKIGQKYHKRLQNLVAAYGAQNAEVIALKRARGISLTAEDQVDLSKLDTLLQETRYEVGLKSRSKTASSEALNPQIVTLDRK